MSIETTGGKIGAITAYHNGEFRDITKVHAGADLVWKKEEEEPSSDFITIDGEKYNIVTIGSQQFLQRNLHYDDGGIDIYSYNNDTSISDRQGYLYSWDAAVRIANKVPGWRLPTFDELFVLKEAFEDPLYAANHLKEAGTENWNAPNDADNSSGFSFLGSGCRYGTSWYLYLSTGYIWTSTVINSTAAYLGAMTYNNTQLSVPGYPKTSCVPVRLIKDL